MWKRSEGRRGATWWAHGALVLLLLCATLVLASCGGGSSSADSVTIDSITFSPTAPKSGSSVSVTGAVTAYLGSGSSSGAVSYQWTQTSGPVVTLSDSTSSTTSFTAPTVTTSTFIVLELTVTLNSVSDSKSVSITVQP